MTSVVLRLDDQEGGKGDLELLWDGHLSRSITAGFRELVDGLSPPDAAVDFLIFACAAYAADKALRRQTAPDRWTRTISLDVPQIDPHRLPIGAAQDLLTFLTGDRWVITTHACSQAHVRLGVGDQGQLSGRRQVALLSGGLDSFAFMASSVSEPTEYVAHRDRSHLSILQQDLFKALHADTHGSGLRQFSFTVNRSGALADLAELESSTRSRSLLFYASAIAVAASTFQPHVIAPENGFISLNPPLVTARRGTLSTRTTHPWTHHLLSRVLEELVLDVRVVNPFATATKGDVALLALDAGPEVVFDTVSCSRPRPRQSSQIHFGNCGYCFPCLVRRAGFYACGTVDETEYRRDPRRDEAFLTSEAGDDFRAVVARARRPFGLADLRTTGPLPADTDIAELHAVVERSRLELADMLQDGMSTGLRRRIGW